MIYKSFAQFDKDNIDSNCPPKVYDLILKAWNSAIALEEKHQQIKIKKAIKLIKEKCFNDDCNRCTMLDILEGEE